VKCNLCADPATRTGEVCLCSNHYRSLRRKFLKTFDAQFFKWAVGYVARAEAARRTDDRECDWCGSTIAGSHPRRKYCSEQCVRDAKNSRVTERRLQFKDVTFCQCGEIVPLGRRTYCSERCRLNRPRRPAPEVEKLRRAGARSEALAHYGGDNPRCSTCGAGTRLKLRVDRSLSGGRRGYYLYKQLKRLGWPVGPTVSCHSCICRSLELHFGRSAPWSS
jgi:ribosomal protein S27AE